MKKYLKKTLSSIVSMVVTLSLIACAGRNANPTQQVKITDASMSCESILSEMSEIEGKIYKLLPESQKTGKNVALGVTGFFLLVPLFFMDFSDAEKVEIEALRSRYNHLTRLYADKKCPLTALPEKALP